MLGVSNKFCLLSSFFSICFVGVGLCVFFCMAFSLKIVKVVIFMTNYHKVMFYIDGLKISLS